jgi:hypothetical protein
VKQCTDDVEYQLLRKTITEGFPNESINLPESIRPYFKMRNLLCIDDGLVVCGQRLLIPKKLRTEVLQQLHSSHQGIERTRRRARQCVYWPGLDNDIGNVVRSCKDCQRLLPSQQKEPMIKEPEPSRPFQSTSTDYFTHAGKQYLIYTDRLSGWPMVKMFQQEATAVKLITSLRKFFAATGIPETMRSDNGPQYIAKDLKNFLQRWGVQLKPSSPYYSQGNGHAEASVKSVKHLIVKCTSNGNLDTDQFALGLLELRNTPREDGLSPAQVLFGHPIRSIIPVHRRAYEEEWQKDKELCEQKRDQIRKKVEVRYNRSSKPLSEFRTGNHVNIQDHRTGRWEITGTVVEVGRNRQYLVRKSNGRLVWRNRRHLRKHHPLMTPSKIYPTNNLDPASAIPTETHSPNRHMKPHLVPATPIEPTRPNSPKFKDLGTPIPTNSPVYSPQPARKVVTKTKLNKLPSTSTTDTKTESPTTGRRRQAPDRLVLDPYRKTYKK